jgi:uncharacterized protein YbgA (DUF1722 family)/uncharacterized protein YbbK (DUF523 family)
MKSGVVFKKPLIGISSCLLGQKVRFDGQHKRDDFITRTLGPFVEWVPICPEVEVGMGVPRESIRLTGDPESPRLIAERSGRDWTDAMLSFSVKRTEQLLKLGLSGYILKKDSPSCGFERVRVYPSTGKGSPQRSGVGMFARALMGASNSLPVEDEGRLNDPKLRDNFIERVFAYHRWQIFNSESFSIGRLVAFHAASKLSLMAHSVTHLELMGRLVARAKDQSHSTLLNEYFTLFMETLKVLATAKKHTNVLEHAFGYVSNQMTSDERSEMLGLIHDYRRGYAPLVVPITLLKHHIKKQNVTYLLGQAYFQPHPKELMLRNHV